MGSELWNSCLVWGGHKRRKNDLLGWRQICHSHSPLRLLHVKTVLHGLCRFERLGALTGRRSQACGVVVDNYCGFRGHAGIFNRPKKNLNSPQVVLGFLSRINLYNPLVRRQSLSLSPNASPCRSSGNHSRRQLQKTIKGFDCKINGRALGSALRHGLGRFDRWAQTQRVSESEAVVAGHDSLALGAKCYHSCDTDLLWESYRFWCFVNFGLWRAWWLFFSLLDREWEFRWNLLKTKAAAPLHGSISLSFIGLWVKRHSSPGN